MSCFTLVAGQLSIACDRTRHAFLERQNAAREYHRVFILPPNCRDWVYAVYGCPCVAEKMVACFRGMPILDGPGGGLMLTYADYPLYFPCPKNIRNDGHTVRGQCHPSAPLLYIPRCQRTVGNLGNHPLVVPLMFCPM